MSSLTRNVSLAMDKNSLRHVTEDKNRTLSYSCSQTEDRVGILLFLYSKYITWGKCCAVVLLCHIKFTFSLWKKAGIEKKTKIIAI